MDHNFEGACVIVAIMNNNGFIFMPFSVINMLPHKSYSKQTISINAENDDSVFIRTM